MKCHCDEFDAIWWKDTKVSNLLAFALEWMTDKGLSVVHVMSFLGLRARDPGREVSI